ncbi:MAG: nucleoside hydrolase [Cyanobacteria bacterium Co-bin8]|nr:nucleoside hydrolase [Cyanobacteria bacterium Co-bin8]
MKNFLAVVSAGVVSLAVGADTHAQDLECPGMLAYLINAAGECVDLDSLQQGTPAAPVQQTSEPIRVIYDTDGAFEDFYAVLVLALASQQPNPPVKLIGVTTMAHGEAYCNNSSGYPQLKQDLLGNFSAEEGTIDGIFQKVISLAQYNDAKIYSGCDESVANIAVANEADAFGKPIPGAGRTPIRMQLPLGGRKALEPCIFHQEFVFQQPDVVCWNEFNRAFRDETLRYVLPTAQNTLDTFGLSELDLIAPRKKASEFIASTICESYQDSNPLTVVTVGPVTNLARAYDKIEKNPAKYGCPRNLELEDLDDVVSTRHMGGAWDTNKADNFDEQGRYRLNEPFPVWTVGNIYYQAGEHIFGMHHLPFPGTNFEGIQTNQHKQAFNSLNNAEFNFWVDALAVDKVLNSGISTSIVPLNATDSANLAGFADRIENNPAVCNTAPAQFVKTLQRSNQPAPGVFVFDTLFFWDTLTVASLWNDFVSFVPFNDLEITTLTNGDPTTVTGQIPQAELFRRDIGNMFRRNRVNNPVEMALSVKPAAGDEDFAETIQDFVFGVVCDE